jgi:hypothetical protein
MGGRTRVNGDYTELRVVEVLVDNNGTPTALRIEAIWATARPGDDPLVWNTSSFVAAAVGPLADADVGDRLELHPAGDGS